MLKRINKLIFALIRKSAFWLFLILVGGFGVRLYKIGNPIADWHSWRQADTASVTRIYLEEGLNLFYPRYYDISSIQTGYFNPWGYRFVELPIFNLIHFVLVKIYSGISIEIWGRLVSVISSLFSIILIYKIAKKIFSENIALLSAFFFAFLPFNIYFGRVILPEPLGVTFGLAALWFFIKHFDNEKRRSLFLSGFFLSLALLIKPYFFFYVFPMVYLAIKKYGFKSFFENRSLLINFLIFIDIVLVPLFFWRAWMGKFLEGVPHTVWAFNGDIIRFRPAFWRWIFGERIGGLILGIWGLIPFTLGIIGKKKNYFSLVFLSGSLFYLTIVATASVRHDYYQILIVPAIAFVLGEGAAFLWDNLIFNKYFCRGLLIFSVIMAIGGSFYQIKEFYKINRPEILAAGEAVRRLTPKSARILAPYNGDTAFLYQTDRFGWPAIDDAIPNLVKKGASFYVSVDLASADTKFIEENYQIIEKTSNYIIADLKLPK